MRNGAWLVGWLGLAAVVSCAASPKPEPAAARAPDGRAPAANSRAIFDRETARRAYFRHDADDFWTPSIGDVQALEEQLPSYLKEEAARRAARRVTAGIPPDTFNPPLWQRALSYHRQYVGIVTSHRRTICGNFFCDDPGFDWRRNLVYAYGGGDCLFNVRYDVDERRLFDLSINAPQ